LDHQEIEVRRLESAISSMQYQIDNLTGEIDSRSARPDECSQCSQTLPAEYLEINRVAVENGKERRAVLIQQKGENEARLYNSQANVGIAKEAVVVETKLEEGAERTTLEGLIAVAKETRNPFDTVVNAYNEELVKEALVNESYYKIIEAEGKVRDHYHFWHHAFGTDLKTLMFEKVCPFLEDRANQYLRELNNPQITVSFGVEKEMKSGKTKDEFCVTAMTTTGSKVFQLFSGAEKQLTSFAVGMALSDLAALQVEGASKFMILDEPFTNLSPENCENIVNFIRTHKMGDDSTILLISNEENLTSLIQNRIHVVKKNGVTSIE
jgi:exonuclease SbcC